MIVATNGFEGLIVTVLLGVGVARVVVTVAS